LINIRLFKLKAIFAKFYDTKHTHAHTYKYMKEQVYFDYF